MNNSALIAISFTITSPTMSPEMIVEVLPFASVKYWRIGDTIGNSIIRRKHNGAVFSLPQQIVDDIEPMVLELLDKLDPIKHELIHLSEFNSIDFELSCAVYFIHPPSCNLSLDTLKRMVELRVSFDLDLIPSDIPEEGRKTGTSLELDEV